MERTYEVRQHMMMKVAFELSNVKSFAAKANNAFDRHADIKRTMENLELVEISIRKAREALHALKS